MQQKKKKVKIDAKLMKKYKKMKKEKMGGMDRDSDDE